MGRGEAVPLRKPDLYEKINKSHTHTDREHPDTHTSIRKEEVDTNRIRVNVSSASRAPGKGVDIIKGGGRATPFGRRRGAPTAQARSVGGEEEVGKESGAQIDHPHRGLQVDVQRVCRGETEKGY